MTKKIFFLTVCFLAFGISAANAQTSGSCGNGVNWEITGTAPDQTLTISYTGSGTGVMDDYTYGERAPWNDQKANLKTLVIGDGVTSIGNYAFYTCWDFTGSLTIPYSVTSIGVSAFGSCLGFTGSLTIPNSVISIGDGAFLSCWGFTGSLTISNSVTSIGHQTFYQCRGFTGSLTIPNSVTSINSYAFGSCTDFTDIRSLAVSPPTLGTDVFENISPSIPLTVPCGSEESYQAASGWSNFTNYVECMPLGISGVKSQSSLQVYPNPVLSNGVLYIADEILQSGDLIEIFDMQGKLLSTSFATGTETVVHIGALPSGTYLLRLGARVVKFEVR